MVVYAEKEYHLVPDALVDSIDGVLNGVQAKVLMVNEDSTHNAKVQVKIPYNKSIASIVYDIWYSDWATGVIILVDELTGIESGKTVTFEPAWGDTDRYYDLKLHIVARSYNYKEPRDYYKYITGDKSIDIFKCSKCFISKCITLKYKTNAGKEITRQAPHGSELAYSAVKEATNKLDWGLEIENFNGEVEVLESTNTYSTQAHGGYSVNSNIALRLLNANKTAGAYDYNVYTFRWSDGSLIKYSNGVQIEAYEKKGDTYYNSLGEDLLSYKIMKDGKTYTIGEALKQKLIYASSTTVKKDNKTAFPTEVSIYIRRRKLTKDDDGKLVDEREKDDFYHWVDKNGVDDTHANVYWDKEFEYTYNVYQGVRYATGIVGYTDKQSVAEHIMKSQKRASRWIVEKPFAKATGIYDIVADFRFGDESSFTAREVDVAKYWTVQVKKRADEEGVDYGFENTSYTSAKQADGYAEQNKDISVYVRGNGKKPFNYKVGLTTEDNISDDSILETSKVDWIKSEDNKSSDGDGMIATVTIKGDKFKELGTIVVVVDLKAQDGAGVHIEPVEIVDHATYQKILSDKVNVIDIGLEESRYEMNDRERVEYSLSYDQQKMVDEYNLDREIQGELAMWDALYMLAAFFGILLLVYSMLLLVCYYFDLMNVFTDMSITRLITFGRVYPIGSKHNLSLIERPKGDKTLYADHFHIWVSFCLGIMAGALFLRARDIVSMLISISSWVMKLWG